MRMTQPQDRRCCAPRRCEGDQAGYIAAGSTPAELRFNLQQSYGSEHPSSPWMLLADRARRLVNR